MDPFSITASAIGITSFATKSITQLHSLIDNLSEAQNVVADVATNLVNIKRHLATLEQLFISDISYSFAAKEDLKKAKVAEAINECGDACNEFSKNLIKWTRHSNVKKLSLRDRLSVGVWNKEKIRTLRTRLQSLVLLRSEKVSEGDREDVNRQLQTLKTKVQEHLDLTKRQQEDAEQRKQGLQEEPAGEEDYGAQRTLAMKEVEKQSSVLEVAQAACGVVFSRVRNGQSGQDISNIVTSENSKVVVGLPANVVGQIYQRIKDVRTEGGSMAVVGVYNGNIGLIDL